MQLQQGVKVVVQAASVYSENNTLSALSFLLCSSTIITPEYFFLIVFVLVVMLVHYRIFILCPYCCTGSFLFVHDAFLIVFLVQFFFSTFGLAAALIYLLLSKPLFLAVFLTHLFRVQSCPCC